MFSCLSYFKDSIKAQLKQSLEDSRDAHVLPGELGIEGRCREGYCIFVLAQQGKIIGYCPFGMVGTYPNTLSAVYTAKLQDPGFPISHPNGFSGTALDTNRTPLAVLCFQRNRMEIGLHRYSPASWRIVTCKLVPRPTVDSMRNSSALLWILGNPIPAPKPISLISSLAVEYPS